MTSFKEQYSQLLALTQLYLLQEYQREAIIGVDLQVYDYLKKDARNRINRKKEEKLKNGSLENNSKNKSGMAPGEIAEIRSDAAVCYESLSVREESSFNKIAARGPSLKEALTAPVFGADEKKSELDDRLQDSFETSARTTAKVEAAPAKKEEKKIGLPPLDSTLKEQGGSYHPAKSIKREPPPSATPSSFEEIRAILEKEINNFQWLPIPEAKVKHIFALPEEAVVVIFTEEKSVEALRFWEAVARASTRYELPCAFVSLENGAGLDSCGQLLKNFPSIKKLLVAAAVDTSLPSIKELSIERVDLAEVYLATPSKKQQLWDLIVDG